MKKDYRFKTNIIIAVPAYCFMMAFLTVILVMSVKGLIGMGPNDDKTMQIIGTVFISAAIFLLLVEIVNALVFRVVVDGNTVEVRKIFGTKKMEMHVGVNCTIITKITGGHNGRPCITRHKFTLDDGVNQIKFTLHNSANAGTLADIIVACGARIDKM